MEQDYGEKIRQIRVDGGPTRNRYLMEFQSDLLGKEVQVPSQEELSGIGAAYLAGIAAGIYDKQKLFENQERDAYRSSMSRELREKKLGLWREAVNCVITEKE